MEYFVKLALRRKLKNLSFSNPRFMAEQYAYRLPFICFIIVPFEILFALF
jgi:hypothetical protein